MIPEIAPEAQQRCTHFGDCGGCQHQDLSYQEQLARKEASLRETFVSVWSEPIPVTPSPLLWHYRNKVDLNFALKRYPEAPPKDFHRETVLGFKRKGLWYWTLDIEECRIAPEGLGGLLEAVRTWAKGQGLRAFDPKTEEGMLRFLLVREGKRSGEHMVVLITRDGEIDAQGFVEAVQSAFSATSILRAVYQGKAEVATGESVETLYGSPTIEEHLHIPDDVAPRMLSFRISPFSFFQTNSLATERLYGIIRQWVKQTEARMLYDLYGGSGGIALACADLVDHVASVESVESATADGIHNATANGVPNVSFHTQPVEGYLAALKAESGTMPHSAAVVVDPPRSGLHPKALRRLIELRRPNILYVSCKPQALAAEMPAFLEVYQLRGLMAVDLFPHTGHVEALAHFALPQCAVIAQCGYLPDSTGPDSKPEAVILSEREESPLPSESSLPT